MQSVVDQNVVMRTIPVHIYTYLYVVTDSTSDSSLNFILLFTVLYCIVI